ncbi:MAG: TonB-dependent receptor, partial [Bacteroidales bacterium]|nr:TonB-dependent receptor [Bacteroidales bacterium]
QGTNNGTSTDIDGNYVIEVPADATLIYSSIGYTTQSVAVNGRAQLDIMLKADAVQLDETIVVAYGTAKKGTYTGAASVLKSDAIADVPTTSFENALNGKIAGLQITQSSGQAGSTSEIRIRGIGSMNASNEPLYVIDGVPVSSGNTGQMSDYTYSTNNIMNTLNPSDIESITVLKDAAASSLYGSRAANGVIMITTKKGKIGKPTITFKASVAVSPDWATDNYEAASTEENIEMLYEIFHDYRTRAGYTEQAAMEYALSSWNSSNRLNGHGWQMSVSDSSVYPKITITPLTGDGIKDPRTAGKYFDWEDAYFGTAVYQSYDLSVSGGTENTNYYSSFAYTKDKGRIAINQFDRITGRVNLNQKIGKYVELASSVNVAHTDKTGFNDTRNLGSNYYLQTRNLLWGFYYPTDYKTGEPYTTRYASYAYNQLYHQKEWENSSKTLKIQASEALTIHLMEGLDLRSVFSYDNSETKDHIYYSKNHYNGSANDGTVTEMSTKYTTIVSSTTLNWNKTFGEKHTVGVLAGFEAEDKETVYQRTSGENMATDALTTPSTAGTITGTGYSWGNSMASILSRVEYNYDGRYYVSGSFRRDGSSKLSPDARWGNFWSVAGSWKANNESFLRDVEWLSNLRIRGSFGINGTLPSDNYGWRALTSYTYKYNNEPGAAITNVLNSDLSWETSYTTNIALEFGIFDQRLSGTIEYFNRDSKDLLQNVPISTITGFSSTLRNVGEINNKGIEVELSGDIIRKRDLTWDATVTASFIDSKVTKLYDGQDIIWSDPTGGDARCNFIYREGESTLAYYGYEWAGVNPENGLNMWYVNNPEKEADMLASGEAFKHYKNGRAVVEGDNYSKTNRIIFGDANPTVYGGINTNVTWKGISLGLNFIYKLGAKLYDGAEEDVNDDGYYWNRIRSKYVYDNRWKKPGDITNVPKLLGNDPVSAMQVSSRHLYNGNFLRLKNITLSYSFPKELVKKAGLGSARVYFNGSNLLTFAAHDLVDPEVNAYGTRGWETPILKTYTFGLEFSF